MNATFLLSRSAFSIIDFLHTIEAALGSHVTFTSVLHVKFLCTSNSDDTRNHSLSNFEPVLHWGILHSLVTRGVHVEHKILLPRVVYTYYSTVASRVSRG